MKVIISKNNIILSVQEESGNLVDIKNRYTSYDIYEVSSDFNSGINISLNIFDKNTWKKKNNSILISEGYIILSNDEILDNENIRKKTQIEKYIDGTDPIPAGYKLNDVKTGLVEKTILEKVETEEITLEEAKNLLVNQAKDTAQSIILSTYPLYMQQNLSSDSTYALQVIAYEFSEKGITSKTIEAIALEMNMLALQYADTSVLVEFRNNIDSFDFSSYVVDLKDATKKKCIEYYRMILYSVVAYRLIKFVRVWCNSKEGLINACATSTELSTIILTDCPVI